MDLLDGETFDLYDLIGRFIQKILMIYLILSIKQVQLKTH